MNYIKKESAIIQKLKESNYALFDGNKDEALDYIGDTLNSFPKYANIVINQQIVTPLIYNRYEGQDLQDRIQELDTKRHYAHESAISSLNQLNRLSDLLELEPFANIDTSDRYQVADFVGQYVSQIYDLGQGKTFDDVTYGRKQEYNITTRKRLSELDSKFDFALSAETSDGMKME